MSPRSDQRAPAPPHPIPCVPSWPLSPTCPLVYSQSAPGIEATHFSCPAPPCFSTSSGRPPGGPQRTAQPSTSPRALGLQNKHQLGKARRSLHYRKVIVKITNRGKLQGWKRLSGKSTRSSEPDLIYISMKTWVNHFQDFRNVLINLSQRGGPQDTFSLWGCCPSTWGVQAHSLTPQQRHTVSCLPSSPRLLSWA